MKVLVLSDSHGNLTNMVRAVEAESPHMIVHLGDGWREARQLHGQFQCYPFTRFPATATFVRVNQRNSCFLGREARPDLPRPHLWRETVLLRAGYAAEEENLDLFLFGHTHQPLVDMRG